MVTRVLLVDDHDIVRSGLRRVLEKQPHIEVVGEAPNGRTALDLIRTLAPDLVLMDIAMRDLNGVDATRHVVAEYPGTKVITLSMHSDPQFVDEALKAGASGYLLKDEAAEELPMAVRAVMNGKVYLSPGVAEFLVSDYIRHTSSPHVGERATISPREREVLQLLAEGKTSKEIASDLCISQKTVESHRGQIMEKLRIHSVAGLTKLAVRWGLTPL